MHSYIKFYPAHIKRINTNCQKEISTDKIPDISKMISNLLDRLFSFFKKNEKKEYILSEYQENQNKLNMNNTLIKEAIENKIPQILDDSKNPNYAIKHLTTEKLGLPKDQVRIKGRIVISEKGNIYELLISNPKYSHEYMVVQYTKEGRLHYEAVDAFMVENSIKKTQNGRIKEKTSYFLKNYLAID